MIRRMPRTVSGTTFCLHFSLTSTKEHSMNSIVYLVGAVVIIIAALSFFGMR
jgi:predicted membrane channel-forming protein YqfA (hemolysin III family)